MCTLIGMWRMFESAPLIVAANRDERLDRPAAPPSLQEQNGRRFLCPTDLSAGGTWLGFNDAETFVAITNRHLALKSDARRSRGLLVMDALAAGSAREIDARFASLDVAPYSGFHLLFADREDAFVIWSDGATTNRIVLAPGVAIITERSFGAAPTSREDLIRTLLNGRASPLEPPNDAALIELLSTRTELGFEGINVAIPELGYGTRSSTILRLGVERGDVHYLHADGPPDRAPFVDQRAHVDSLLGGS